MLKIRLLLTALFITCFSLYFYFVLIPVSHGYDHFIQFAADLINKKQRLPAIRAAFPETRFIFIKHVITATAVILVVLFALSIRYSSALYSFFFSLLRRFGSSCLSFIHALKNTNKTAKAVFSLTICYLVIQSVWYMNRLPFIHDEAYTISNFVVAGPIASITFYPYPNNHILFSLFSYPFSFLPLKPEIAFRLPSLTGVVLTCFVLFRLLLIFFEEKIAALGVVMFVCMLPVMNYAIFARGYSLVFLFACLSTLAFIKIIQDNSYYHHALLIVFSVLGLYTIPSYVYPFAAIYTVYFCYGIFIKNTRFIITTVVSGLVCAACTVVLYLPVIITSGGLKNFVRIIYLGYEDSSSIGRVGSFIDTVYALQFFENNRLIVLFLLFVTVSVIVCIKKISQKKVSLLEVVFLAVCLLGFLTPLLSFLVQKKMAAPRTHSYAALFFVGFTFIALKQYVSHRWKQPVFIGITVLIITMNIAFAHKSGILRGEAYCDASADIIADEMLKNKVPADTCYTFDCFYLANMQLKYALAKRPLTVFQKQPGSPSSAAFNFNNKYEWILTLKEELSVNRDSIHKYYAPVIDRKDAILWKKKE